MVAALTIDPRVASRDSDLRARGAILLISCYELGHQPLSLASPLAHLAAAGFAPVAIDTSVDDLDPEAVRTARLVAVSVPMHTALRLGAAITKRVREINPDAHICLYGLYASLNSAYLLGDDAGDSVIGGEYERPLVELASALEGQPHPRSAAISINGVGTRREAAKPVLNAPRSVLPMRAELPGLRSYAGLERDGVIFPAGYVEATRGCHHTCLHCPITPIYGGRFTVVPRETVLADARVQVEAGARHLTFGDPDFFNGPGHSLRICRVLHDEFPWLTFDATIKVEHLIQHRRLLPELAELGCAFVVTAVESLNDQVLRALKKGHDRSAVNEALDLLDDVGIPMRPSLLPFSPWETIESYLDLLRFVAERDLFDHIDPIMLAIRLLVPPGSALLDVETNATWLGSLDAEAFTYRWEHPDPRMDALYRRVSTVVEQSAATGDAPRDTFASIWSATVEFADRRDESPPEPREKRAKPPRLTESWFC